MPEPKFRVARRGEWPDRDLHTFTLVIDDWDDFHFKTSFSLHYGTGTGTTHIGSVKIAQVGMSEGDPHTHLPPAFTHLSSEFFSLGQDREYYENLTSLPDGLGKLALIALRDVANDESILATARPELSFRRSLTRSTSVEVLTTQFRRIIAGKAPLTAYSFTYNRPSQAAGALFKLSFDVTPYSSPPTNLHVLIGANGVGKSWLLRDFAAVADGSAHTKGTFIDSSDDVVEQDFPFTNVVHVGFSAFDSDAPRSPLGASGAKVRYVGLTSGSARSLDDQFSESRQICSRGHRRERWLRAIKILTEADGILADTPITAATPENQTTDNDETQDAFGRMSSGHKIVILTITRLVELVEERTLVLLDEPETHLHPPLLSALTRAISDLMLDRNGVAILATHSPVVLQEVPGSCVWMLQRVGDDLRACRLSSETFGESVSRLTSEVFRLDSNQTGYVRLLRDLLRQNNESVADTLEALADQLGAEGRFTLGALAHSEGVPDV